MADVLALLNLDPSTHQLVARAHLSFAVSAGKTRLKRSLAEPPLQVQRALYLDDSLPDMAFLYLLNPTPGIFQGDIQTIHIDTGPQTRVHLTTPSATKIYAMPDQDARQTLELKLGEGSYVEYLPEPMIPFRGARLIQRTKVYQSPGSTLVMGDVILPGRVANGEDFRFHSLDRRLTINGPTGHPIFHEASVLTPHTLNPLGRGVLNAEYPVTGTLLIMAPDQKVGELGVQLRDRLAAADNSGSKAAMSMLPNGTGLVVKVLSRDSKTVTTMFRTAVVTARHYFLGHDLTIQRKS